jgi:hypothetical protein
MAFDLRSWQNFIFRLLWTWHEKHLHIFPKLDDVMIRVVTLTSRLTSRLANPAFYRPTNSQWFTNKDVHKVSWFVRSFTNSRYRNNKTGYQGGEKNRSTVYYVVALGVLVGGMSYAAVPLYRLFCQVKLIFVNYVQGS